jgi:hypothetical protein
LYYRNILADLESWTEKTDRKPLVIRGARQVGKTTAVNIFAEKFKQYLYFNLDKREDRSVFEQDLSIEDLVAALFFHKNQSMGRGKTLIFIDEIQNVPDAIKQLRYFYESKKELYVIASGSLLQTTSRREINYPVGRIEFKNMYPFTFSEHLKADNREEAAGLMNRIPIPAYSHKKMLELFHRYAMIGGMPEVIKKFLENNDLVMINEIYKNLLLAYKEDVKKYARNEKMMHIIRHAIDSAPLEAGRRIKFHGFGNSSYGSREMGEALRLLEKAMLINLVYPTTNLKPPVKPDTKKSPRLQFIDTGLLNYSAGLQNHFFGIDDLHSFYRGLLAEHIVGQELKATYLKDSRMNFWTREKRQGSAELDFALLFDKYIIPIEVKSGKSGTLRSLHQFMDRTDHPYGVRIYSGKLSVNRHKTPAGTEYLLLNLPYYLTGVIEKYLDWFINSYSL